MSAPDVPAPMKREALDLIREGKRIMADPNRTIDQVDAIYARLLVMMGRFRPYLEVDEEE